MTLMVPHTLYGIGIWWSPPYLIWNMYHMVFHIYVWFPYMYDRIFFRPALKESTACPNNEDSLCINNEVNLEADYFVAGLNTETDRDTSAKTTVKIQDYVFDMVADIGCFEGSYSRKVKEDTKPYQVPPRHVALGLQVWSKNRRT